MAPPLHRNNKPTLTDEEFTALEAAFTKGPHVHYKGGLYEVLGLGREEATLQVIVIYKSCRNNTLWTRTLEDFTSSVQIPEGERLRFTPVK